MKDAYEDLLEESHPPVQFWQTPAFVIGEFAVSFGLGALIIATHCFGTCK